MATAINAIRVPDTMATPMPARAGSIGRRVDAEGAARVRFPMGSESMFADCGRPQPNDSTR